MPSPELGADMKRREFITLIGSTVASWPLSARAQEPVMPVIGFLGAPSPMTYTRYVAALHQGLKEAGYVEGQNVRFEYRWAEGHYDRLSELATDLVSQGVAVVIPIGGAPPTLAAKAATSTIPIVFNMTADPVRLGVVASLNRPGGNVTGVAMMGVELEAKRLELLREFVPTSALIAMLVNPSNAQAETQSREVQKAAHVIGQQVLILSASTERELETAFAAAVKERASALLVGADTYFTSKAALIVALAARYAVLTIYEGRDFATAGGLMSYGTDLANAYREAGVYAGRILKGSKPADLPVMQPTKFELIINLKTAKALGLTVPLSLTGRADELIE
jgi:putative tryptophan/tyrosine transport system substrate-binding protein